MNTPVDKPIFRMPGEGYRRIIRTNKSTLLRVFLKSNLTFHRNIQSNSFRRKRAILPGFTVIVQVLQVSHNML